MKLKESSFTIELPTPSGVDVRTIRLSGSISEWLFASKFWSEINRRCGTIFDQYEEDDASANVVEVICDSLSGIIEDHRCDPREIEFVHGWDAQRNPLKAKINSRDLVRELTDLRNFLREGLKFNVGAYLSL